MIYRYMNMAIIFNIMHVIACFLLNLRLNYGSTIKNISLESFCKVHLDSFLNILNIAKHD